MAQEKKNLANFAKGDIVFKRGERVNNVYLIQSGLVSASMPSPTGRVEIYQATAPQTIGVEAMLGAKVYESSAYAMNDTAILEVPAAAALQALDKAAPTLKLVIMGLIGKVVSVHAELRTIKLDGDTTPCPPLLTAKLFATVFHVVSYSGTPKGDALRVVWTAFRKYCQRVFSESPVRLEQLIYLLANMGLAELEMVKSDTDPDGPEELGFVRFKDIKQLESFSEFFRKRLKALGPEDCMEPKDPCIGVAEVLLRSFGTKNPDPSVELNVLADDIVATLRSELADPKISLPDIETFMARGLPLKLVTSTQGKVLKFSPVGLKRMFTNCRILAKIAEWNNAGRAPGAPDPNAKKAPAKA